MSNTRIPAPCRPFRHKIDVQLRFNDVDIFGHVNNSVYLQFFDLGKMRYFESALGKDFADSGLVVVIVNINCDFFSPSFLDEPLQVMTQTVHIGDKSITLEQRIADSVTGDVKCMARTVMAGFNPKELTSAPIPDFARKAIEEYESCPALDSNFAKLNDEA